MSWLKFTVTLAGILFFFQQSFAETVAISLRGSEGFANSLCAGQKCKLIQTSTKEFANGNTFVRFSESVAGQSVVIPVRSELTSDQLFELLIKIRTAKQDFAQDVFIITENGSNTIEVSFATSKTRVISGEQIIKMIKAAGADGINDTILGGTRLAPKKFRMTKDNYIVDTGIHSELAKNLASDLGLAVLNAEQALNYAKYHLDAHAIVVSTVAAPQNESFLKSVDLVYRLKTRNQMVTYVSPYLPYARTDKKDQEGVTITGRLAADLIENAGVDAVEFVRAHAPQSEGFFSVPTIQTMGKKTITDYLREQGVEMIISPDAGFQKDATLYADLLGVPVGVVNKQRDPLTGESKLHDLSGPSIVGKKVAVIDDETASGSTLHQVAELLNKLGAKSTIGVVTHLAGDAKKALESPYLQSIVVTDTIPVTARSSNLKVLAISKEISFDLKKRLGIMPLCRKILE